MMTILDYLEKLPKPIITLSGVLLATALGAVDRCCDLLLTSKRIHKSVPLGLQTRPEIVSWRYTEG